MRLSFQKQWLPFLAVSVLLGLIGRRCCDGCPADFVNITERETSISSPGYPSNYGINKTCRWMIKYDPNKYIVRIRLNRFEIEECKSCDCDSLQSSTSSNFLSSPRKICGRLTENVLSSPIGPSPPFLLWLSRSTYYIKFVSDGSHGFPGFQASVIAESLTFRENSYLNASGDETLHFSTPKYPAKYPSGWGYQWRLIVEEGRQVQLNFEEFELESSQNCENDWVEVREFSSRGTFMGGPYCGSTKPAAIRSKGNVLWVQFRSDSNDMTTYKGIKCNFHATGDGTLLVGGVVFSFLLPFLVLTALTHN